jgi:hypothetical protein
VGKLLFHAIEFDRDSEWTVGERHRFAFTARGNLELWQNPDLKLLWESGTTGRGEKFVMQSDGNMVIYDATRQSVWASDTFDNREAVLAVEEEGRLVIYAADLTTTLWRSDGEGSPAPAAPPPESSVRPARSSKKRKTASK